MPLRKRIGIMGGWLLECLAGLEPASLRYATQCDTSYTIGTISRDCGLSVVTRGEFTQRFRLSQAYAYIIPRFSAPKLAKFQKKKKLTAIRCRLPSTTYAARKILRSQLLIAHDTYKTILTRQLRREVQELRPDAVYRALVHPVLLPCPHCCMPVVVVSHCPSFIRVAIIIRTSDDAQPPLRPAQCPPVVKRDSFEFCCQPYRLLCRRVADKRMTAAATTMPARLQPRFFHGSLDAVLIAQNLSDKLVCVLSDLMLLHSLIHRPRITLCTSYHSFPNAHISCTRQVAHLSSRHCSRSKYRLPFLSTRWLYPL